ncbi:Ribonuclease P protein subunit p21 [Cryptotrichosporon argae]
MARKTAAPRTDVLPPVLNRDVLQRYNFTYQSSVYLSALGTSSAGAGPSARAPVALPHPAAAQGRQRRAGDAPGVDFAALARGNMRASGRMINHCQVKCDPSVKRTVCKGCAAVLVPGLTSRVRVRTKHRTPTLVYTCTTCQTSLALPCPASAETAVDGPRRRRRAKRRVAYHEREAAVGGADGLGEAGQAEETRGRGKGKASAAGAASTAGHVLWVGNQKLVGWGQAERA